MKEHHLQEIYQDGYQAFERGEFQQAETLADKCLALASRPSYWYAGAWGLKCWLSNFMGRADALEHNAALLLELETGDDKPWFDGVALLNLGLAKRRDGRMDEARALLQQAAKRYQAQRLRTNQPGEWKLVLDYFSTLSRWAASGEASEWEKYSLTNWNGAGERSELSQQLSAAAQLMLRHAEGQNVREEATEMI